jgi:hypothetical protein
MKNFFLACLLSIFCLLSISPLNAQNSGQWKEDIAYLRTELPKQHVDLFNQLSEAEFNQALDSLEHSLDDREEWQIVYGIAEILKRIGDTHTQIIHNPTHGNPPCFPITFRYFSDGIYVTLGPIIENKSLVGSRLLSINGVDIPSIYKKAHRVVSVENDAMLKYHFMNILNRYYVLNYLGLVNQPEASFQLEDTSGQIHDIVLSTVPLKEVRNHTDCLAPEKVAFTDRNRKAFFWQEYLEEDSLLYIRYNLCASKEYYKRIKTSNSPTPDIPSFKKFEKQVLRTMKRKPVKKLVFDVSNNPGGSTRQGSRLIRNMYMQSYTGEAYLITGRRTYSSAIVNAIEFQKLLKATIIGEETSGKPNHFGEIRSFELPNSKALILYSTKLFKRVEGEPSTIHPDIVIEQSFDEFMQGINPAWEYIKSL